MIGSVRSDDSMFLLELQRQNSPALHWDWGEWPVGESGDFSISENPLSCNRKISQVFHVGTCKKLTAKSELSFLRIDITEPNPLHTIDPKNVEEKNQFS